MNPLRGVYRVDLSVEGHSGASEKNITKMPPCREMTPPPPSPYAPSAAVTNSEVALALIAPPSPASPAPHGRAGGTNLFRDGVKKRHSNLSSTGYSPAKKKGGRRTRDTGISPRDANEFPDAGSDGDDDNDKDYSPTPAYKIVRTTRPKRRDAKVIPNSSYFAFLRPWTFDTKRFIRGHPQFFRRTKSVGSKETIRNSSRSTSAQREQLGRSPR